MKKEERILKRLTQLIQTTPNDMILGKLIREEFAHATVNNSKSRRVTSHLLSHV